MGKAKKNQLKTTKKQQKTAQEKLDDLRGLITAGNKKKVLMLSLGTGKYVDGKQQPYDETMYRLPGRKKGEGEMKSRFVAQPLVSDFEPDEIIIIGTSKSQWKAFYDTFGDKKERDTGVLNKEGGRGLTTEELKSRSEEVERIYNEGIRYGAFFEGKGTDKKVNFTILMTHYGVDDWELSENYKLLKDKLDSVLCEENVEYEVAFDITHSFRSMPIYNLVILNYLKNVGRIKVDITNVYYGNYEVKKETEEIALIVDFKKLTGVMNLSNCVSEFKHTGNAASLLNSISDDEKDLRDALERFDMATQINSYKDSIDSLKKLIECCHAGKEGKESGEYVSLCDMISDVICEKFFEKDAPKAEKEKKMLEWFAKLKPYEKQYRLAKWYYYQNRCGLAVATGLEALMNCLVPFYQEWKRISGIQDHENGEAERTQARLRMADNAERIKDKLFQEGSSGLAVAVDGLFVLKSDVYTKYNGNRGRNPRQFTVEKRAKKARNIFAHNLGGGADESMDLDEFRESVEDFFAKCDRFLEEIEKDRDGFGQAYRDA